MSTTLAPEPSTEQPKGKKKSKLASVLVPLLLVLAGLSVLIYPVVATQWNNVQQTKAAHEYAKLEKDEDPVRLNEQFENAKKYNETRQTGPILDPWLARISPDNAEYQAYLNQLNLNNTMGRLIVPAADADLPIYHGTSEDVLQRGVGHLYGSDLPVGEKGTHAVLTAHTGLPTATLFDNLKDVVEGDAIYIQVAGEKLKYEVDKIEVVLPEETDSLRPVADKDLITLITCTPYGINTHRLLVHGHRVPMDPEDEAAFAEKGPKIQWWMWAIGAAALLIAVLLGWWLWKMLRGGAAKKKSDDGEADSVDELDFEEDDVDEGFTDTDTDIEADDHTDPDDDYRAGRGRHRK